MLTLQLVLQQTQQWIHFHDAEQMQQDATDRIPRARRSHAPLPLSRQLGVGRLS